MGAIPKERRQGCESNQREGRAQVRLPVAGQQGRDAHEGAGLYTGGDQEREEAAQIKTDHNGRAPERSAGSGNGSEMIFKGGVATLAVWLLLIQVKRPAYPTTLRKPPRDFMPYPTSRP